MLKYIYSGTVNLVFLFPNFVFWLTQKKEKKTLNTAGKCTYKLAGPAKLGSVASCAVEAKIKDSQLASYLCWHTRCSKLTRLYYLT